MAKVIAYEVQVSNISTVIQDQNDLRNAIKQTNAEFQKSKFGTDQYKRAEKELAQLKNLQTQFRNDLKQTAREQQLAATKGSGSYRSLNNELVTLKNRFRELTAEERKAFGPGILKQVQKLDTELKDIDAKLGGFQRNVGNYASAFRVLGGVSLAELATVGGIAYVAGQGIRGLTNLAKDSVETFADFNRQISILGAVSRASTPELAALEANARKLGETTQFTAKQVAELQTNFARAGFNPEEIINATEATLNLALATGTDLAEASLVVADNLRAYGLSAQETTRFTDVLVGALNTSNITLENYKEASKELAPISKVLGVSVEESAAAIGILGDNGIKGTAATTTLASGLLRLGDENKKYAKAAEAAGIEIFDQQGAFVGLGQLIENTNEAFQGLTEQQKLANLSRIFGVQAARNFATLLQAEKEVITENGRETLKGGKALKAYAEQLENTGGAAAQAAKIINDTLDGDLRALASAVEGAKINFVSFFEDGIRNVVQGVTSLVGGINSYLSIPLSEQIQEQQSEFNALVVSLINVNENIEDVNTKEEVRSRLISEIQQKYPDYIGNINLETASTKELRNALAEANSQFTQKIILQRQEEELNEIFTKRADLIEDLVRLQKEQAEGGIRQRQNVLGGGIGDTTVEQDIERTERIISKLDEQIQEITNRRGEEINQLNNLLGTSTDETAEKVEEGTEVITDALKEEINTINSLKARLKELKAERDTTAIGSTQFNNLSSEIKTIEAQIKSLTDTANGKVALAFAEGSVGALKKEVEKIKKELEAASPADAEALNLKLVNAEKELEAAQKAIEEAQNRIKAANRKDLTLNLLPEDDAISSQLENQLSIIDSGLAAQSKLREDEAEKTAKKLSEVYKKSAEDRAAQELEAQEALNEALVDLRSEAFSSLGDVFSNLEETSSTRQENEVRALEERYEREIELAEGNARRQEQLEQELDQRRAEIERREFERQKQYRRAAALTSLAEGIINILSAPTTIPQPFAAAYKAVRIGLLTLTTSQQIANINAQQVGERGLVVELARGGMLTGATHRDPGGGIPMVINGKNVLAEHGEWVERMPDNSVAVLNKRSTAVFKPFLQKQSGLNYQGKKDLFSSINSYKNFGVRFAQSGAILQPEVASVLSGQTGGAQVSIRSIEISDRSVNKIAASTAAAVEYGARRGTALGASDSTKRLEREERLRRRTGV